MVQESATAARASGERHSRALIAAWLVGVGSVTLLACLFLGGALRANRQQAARRHEERMNPAVWEAGAVAADVAVPPGATPGEVRVGVYVERISKFFDVTRFPVEEHLLTICLELAGSRRDQVILVADEAHCGVSSRVHLPAFQIARQAAVEKPHAYQSSLGDPRLSAGHRTLRSQFRYGIWLRRDGWGFGWKLFQGLYASLAVALAALFIKPTAVDPRFGLGVGAFFTTIANSYVTSALLVNVVIPLAARG